MAANDVPCCEVMFWAYLVISVSLVCFAGLMSGLTLGLMSLSLVDLEVLAKAGRPQDRKSAEKILPLVKNQHLLLCTLLIGNAMAMEALPIFLDALLPAWGAILISVTLILAFGEIIPQAVCSRYGLSVGAKLSVVVRIIVILIFPLAYPISKLLDWVLGKKHSALLRRAELKTLVDLHGNEAGKGGELTRDETTIIAGALDMTQKTAKDAMTPISESFSLDINSRLDEKTVGEIMSKGHSRVPIYSGIPTNVIGLILVKNLIKFRPEDETPVRELTIRRIPRVYDHLPLYDILNQFQKGQSHMAVVVKSKIDGADHESKTDNNLPQKQVTRGGICENEELSISINLSPVYSSDNNERGSPIPNVAGCVGNYLHPNLQSPEYDKEHWNISCQDLESLSISDEEVIGIITLEDVMEELLQEEIFDETDDYVDVHNKITINMLPLRRSELASPKGSSSPSPQRQWRSSRVASPLSSSSYSVSPILNSPIPPHFQSPFIRPTLSSSPTNINHSTPPITTLHFSSSPNRVSRKPYEKLRKANHT